MSFAIMVRNPHTLRLSAIVHDDCPAEVVEFKTADEAEAASSIVPLCQAWQTYIIEIPNAT